MLKSASVRIPDICRVETIKDRHIQVMPPHGNHNPSLREMHALLEEMKTLNSPFDHQEGWWNDKTQALKKWAGKNMNKDYQTAQEKLEALFDASSDKKQLLVEFLQQTTHVKDVFNTLKTLVLVDELAEIVASGSSEHSKDASVKMTNSTNIYMKLSEQEKRTKLLSILDKMKTIQDAFNSLKVVAAYRDDMLVIWKKKLEAPA